MLFCGLDVFGSSKYCAGTSSLYLERHVDKFMRSDRICIVGSIKFWVHVKNVKVCVRTRQHFTGEKHFGESRMLSDLSAATRSEMAPRTTESLGSGKEATTGCGLRFSI